MHDEKAVTLAAIGNGALAELFEIELSRVMENISDINTDPEAKREITIKLKFEPTKDRRVADIGIACSSKLAAAVGARTRFYFGTKGGRFVAVEEDPKQPGMFDDEQQAPRLAAVASIAGARKDGE